MNGLCLEIFCSGVLFCFVLVGFVSFLFRDFVGFVLLVSIPATPALSEQCVSNKIQWLWSDPPQDLPAQFQVLQLTLE